MFLLKLALGNKNYILLKLAQTSVLKKVYKTNLALILTEINDIKLIIMC